MVVLGVGIKSPACSKKQNQLLQTHENVKVFPKIVSPSLLLSQPPSWQNDCGRAAPLGECTAPLGAAVTWLWMRHFWVLRLSSVP